MTTNLTNRSKLNPSVTTSVTIDPSKKTCTNATKFGDDDLASKRRKDHNRDDEYNTVFTKKLNESPQLNSTLNTSEFETNDTFHSFNRSCNSLDFNGGPITNDDNNTIRFTITGTTIYDDAVDANSYDEPDFGQKSITTRPSDSSFGFHNTFSVLERQMETKKQPKLSQQQIEYLLHENTDEAVTNPIYVDIPISDESYLRAISGNANGSFEDNTHDVDDNGPSLFELELEAMQRVNQLLRGGGGCSGGSDDGVSATVVYRSENATNGRYDEGIKKVPANVRASNPSLLEDFYQQDGGDYSDYVYHVARRKNGQVYLRVVRSTPVDKGNDIHFN